MTTTFKKELYNEDLVYSSVVFGMGFWIDDAIPVCDWENWDELSAYHHSHLMHVNQMCILKRDSQQIDYYADVFGIKSEN